MTTRSNVPYLRVVTIPSPTVGLELSISAPGQGLWRILSLAFLLTTDATVANRTVDLVASDGTSIYFDSGPPAVQAASLARSYAAYEGSVPSATLSNDQTFGFPTRGLWLDSGHALRTVTTGIQVGDQYSAIALQVEEFPTGGSTFWVPTVERAEYGMIGGSAGA